MLERFFFKPNRRLSTDQEMIRDRNGIDAFVLDFVVNDEFTTTYAESIHGIQHLNTRCSISRMFSVCRYYQYESSSPPHCARHAHLGANHLVACGL